MKWVWGVVATSLFPHLERKWPARQDPTRAALVNESARLVEIGRLVLTSFVKLPARALPGGSGKFTKARVMSRSRTDWRMRRFLSSPFKFRRSRQREGVGFFWLVWVSGFLGPPRSGRASRPRWSGVMAMSKSGRGCCQQFLVK